MAQLSKHTKPDGVETRHMANISIQYIDRPGEGAIYRYLSRQGKIAGIFTRRSRVDYLLVDPRGL